jgi:[ribosomal protein S5]-alanine N-acetyltransferase
MQFTTERLLLREFKESDWQAVWAYQSQPLYLRYYEWEDRQPEDVRAFVRMFLTQQKLKPRTAFQFAVVLKDDHQLIGNCGIRTETGGLRTEAGRNRPDSPTSQTAEIGYELDPQYWGQGYATEAARSVLQLGFETFKLHRISANCVADNVGSARVLEKLGMRLEGRLRENQYFKGRWWDTFLYAILEEEYRAGLNPP